MTSWQQNKLKAEPTAPDSPWLPGHPTKRRTHNNEHSFGEVEDAERQKITSSKADHSQFRPRSGVARATFSIFASTQREAWDKKLAKLVSY